MIFHENHIRKEKASIRSFNFYFDSPLIDSDSMYTLGLPVPEIENFKSLAIPLTWLSASKKLPDTTIILTA